MVLLRIIKILKQVDGHQQCLSNFVPADKINTRQSELSIFGHCFAKLLESFK
jgi:hypothetical protein